MDEKRPKGSEAEDDRYIIEDTGESVEDIEHEMEVAARQADDTLRRGGPAPVSPVAEEGVPPAGESAEVQQWKDRYLRTLADFENYRKRADREKADFFKYAMAGLMRDLLPVLDNFDRSLEHAEEGDDFHRGVLLIYKQMFDALTKSGLKAIEESNVAFDPNIHEAVIREEDPSVPNHTVVAVLQKGYFMHDRLLRPAMVKVAVGGPERRDSVE